MKVVTSSTPVGIDADGHTTTQRRTAAYGQMAEGMRVAVDVDGYAVQPMD
jgi:hypothetical protein